MAETEYKMEGWASAPPSQIKEGDHVRWTPTKRYRTDMPKQIVGYVETVELDDDGAWVTVRISGASRVVMYLTARNSIQRYVSWTEVNHD